MHIRFTKMQGAGNDFVVLDETQGRLGLTTAQYRFLADRHFGVGADQILTVRPSPATGLDFEYVIHNADGGEVEHCGNGARCFVRYVRDKGLTDKSTVRVKVQKGEIELRMNPDGRVTVDMGAPVFDWECVPFNPNGLISDQVNGWPVFDLALGELGIARVGVVSMGNPHAVQRVDNVDTFPVLAQGPLIEIHPRLSESGERGLHADRLAQPDQAAGVRARRGRDPGLRHRGLRGGGGGHPPSLAGRASGCADPRRRAHHRVGGPGRQPGADDRPGHLCF